jgi:hypothetical protein
MAEKRVMLNVLSMRPKPDPKNRLLAAPELEQLLREIDGADFQASAFDDDRLALSAKLHLRWGDRDGAHRAYDELIAKHPDSEAADRAREWMAGERAFKSE